ncbi:HXXEE domain-containing protein [Actinomyces bovis]|nr:HXXEE domain-containing protein [Actinomyces bovis]
MNSLGLSRLDLATLGLGLCYFANDIEELLTMRSSTAKVVQRLPEWLPLPLSLREQGVNQAHINLAVGLIGMHWVGASLAGFRSGGRSVWFQNAAAAWSLHGFAHIGSSLMMRGYTSGVATAPLVLGYGVFAFHELRVAGVPKQVTPSGVAVSGVALLAAHSGAALLLHTWRHLSCSR